jgi:prefoldin subunit 5
MRSFALVLCAALAAGPSIALAAGGDPDWPCIQRKVPELSMAQVWNGPELPASARAWASDQDVADLVKEVSARRVPLDEASGDIRTFAGTLEPGQASERLGKLAQGLFDHMNAERSQVISGIGRYAKKQVELAATLRKEASELDAMRGKADANAAEVTDRTDRLTWETRVFEERVQSLTYVCEVPTLIEQRLYALSKTVAEALKDAGGQ